MNAEAGAGFTRSPLFRLAFLALLVVLLQIPILAISLLVSERQGRRDGAVTEVSAKWGRAQALTGPVLVVPYRVPAAIEEVQGGTRVRPERIARAYLLPERLTTTGKLTPESRRRGIFGIPVYDLDLALSGTFAPPDFAALGIDPAHVVRDGIYLAVGISDVRAVQQQVDLAWGDGRSSFLPGTGDVRGAPTGLHAPVTLPSGEGPIAFSFPLRLHGTIGFTMTPSAKQTDVRLASSWPSPSFQGDWLPARSSVGKDGFTAEWSIPYLGRNVPQQWTSDADQGEKLAAARFGVDLLQTVDAYRMTARSVSYATLFLVMTLLSVWLAEVLAGILVHPIQSLLLCTALCVFYLLELSLAEHVGFVPAYLAAAAAIAIMIGAYGSVALRSARRGVSLGAGIAGLYGFLYVVLVAEDYALLLGSIGLFVLLAAVMIATRRVDWERLEARRGAAAG